MRCPWEGSLGRGERPWWQPSVPGPDPSPRSQSLHVITYQRNQCRTKPLGRAGSNPSPSPSCSSMAWRELQQPLSDRPQPTKLRGSGIRHVSVTEYEVYRYYEVCQYMNWRIAHDFTTFQQHPSASPLPQLGPEPTSATTVEYMHSQPIAVSCIGFRDCSNRVL